MRPHELTMRGFRSWRDEVTFDFRGRRLIGIVGPIGAGKSTILDAMAFALFAKTPRVQRDTKSLIHQLSDAAHVQLLFEVDGVRWRVTRALRRRGQGQTKLERLDDDDVVLETVTMDRPVRDRVEQLLGMDFDTFGRSVLLAQNRFAEFLLAPDAARNAVLKGVFGYERFDAALAATREHVARAETEMAGLEADGRRAAEARTQLTAAEATAAAAIEERERLAAVAPEVDRCDAALRDAAAAIATASGARDQLQRAAATLPAAEAVTEAAVRRATAADDVDRATEDLARTEAALLEAEAARDAAHVAAAELRAFEDLVAQLEIHVAASTAARSNAQQAQADADRAAAAAQDAHQRRVAAETVLAGAESKAVEATAHFDTADRGLHAARHAEMALSLRAGLVPGEPCPVCEQPVVAPPAVPEGSDVAAAERTRVSALAVLENANRTRDDAATGLANAVAADAAASTDGDRRNETAKAAEAEVRRAEATLAATHSELVDRLGEGDPGALLNARRAEFQAIEDAARSAAEAVRSARARADTARADANEASAAITRLREGIIAARALVDDLERTSVDGAAEAIAEARAEIAAHIAARAAAAIASIAAAELEAENATRARERALDAVGLAPDADLSALLTAARVRAAEAEERARVLAELAAADADIDVRIGAVSERLLLATRLRDDLQPSRFLAWLLDEERAALAALASVHLQELTDGDYRFSEDGAFKIVDVNAAGAVRAAESLSGGETFLASLALALALADMVTRGGGRLDAFFLDEGFGSLDPEHIERAMTGIEHLVGDGSDRLVILVSHVAQMHELMEDLIVLEKDEVAGTSRVLAGARLP